MEDGFCLLLFEYLLASFARHEYSPTRQSANPNNTVFALIRSQATAGPVNELAAKRSNIKVIETDVSSLDKLNQTAESISEVTSGKLDVLIYNAYSAGTDEGKLLPPTAL